MGSYVLYWTLLVLDAFLVRWFGLGCFGDQCAGFSRSFVDGCVDFGDVVLWFHFWKIGCLQVVLPQGGSGILWLPFYLGFGLHFLVLFYCGFLGLFDGLFLYFFVFVVVGFVLLLGLL